MISLNQHLVFLQPSACYWVICYLEWQIRGCGLLCSIQSIEGEGIRMI